MANSVKSVKWTAGNGSEIEAVITVSKIVEEIKATDWGFTVGTELYETMTVEIMVNGKFHSETTQMPKVIETGNYMESTKADMRAKGAYAHITDTLVAKEAQYNEIMTAIAEAKAEVETTFAAENTEVAAEEIAKEEAKVAAKTEWANRVIAEANQRTEVLSAKDEIKWCRSYNNLHNEGGDGYIPTRVTKEDVEFAKTLLNK